MQAVSVRSACVILFVGNCSQHVRLGNQDRDLKEAKDVLRAAELGVKTQLAVLGVSVLYFYSRLKEKYDKRRGKASNYLHFRMSASTQYLEMYYFAETKLSAVTNLIFDVL